MQYLKINEIVHTISITHKFDKDFLIAINTSDVDNGVMGEGVLTSVKELKGQFKKTIQKHDILFSEIRPANRRFAMVKIDDCEKYVVSTKLMVLRKFNDDVDLDYFYYCLTNQSFLDILQRRAENRIASFPQITFELLSEYSFPIPPLEEQKSISKCIANLDNKITLNRTINLNYEALAKQIYNYWFVQFDFPDENGKPYKSSGGKMVWNETLKKEIPDGWEVKPIFDELDISYGYPFSTDLFTNVPTNKPLIRIRDILDGTISAYTTEDVSEKYRLQEGDVIVGMDGNFHMNYWHNNITYLNQRCVRLRPIPDSTISSIQIFYGIQPYIKAKEKTTKGSTVGHLSDSDLKGLFIIKANDSIQNKERKNQLDTLLNKIISNKKELLKLYSLRSFLLPLLMTGQAKLK